MNRYIYNGLLRVYAGCMELPGLEEEKKEAYIKDAWRLFEQFVQQFPGEVSSNIINSMLLVHTQGYRIQMAEELVVPLFEQYKVEPDQFTYQHLSGNPDLSKSQNDGESRNFMGILGRFVLETKRAGESHAFARHSEDERNWNEPPVPE